MFVGLTALSVDIRINLFALYLIERSIVFFVPIILFTIALLGLSSQIGTCL